MVELERKTKQNNNKSHFLLNGNGKEIMSKGRPLVSPGVQKTRFVDGLVVMGTSS